MGVGYKQAESSNVPGKNGIMYPNIVDVTVSQGIINVTDYSLWLDDLKSSSATLLFGAMDTDKYLGNLVQLPVVPSRLPNGTDVYRNLAVEMTSSAFGGSLTQQTHPAATFDFGFGKDSVIRVPIQEMIIAFSSNSDRMPSTPFKEPCNLGFRALSSVFAVKGIPNIFGDTFLRSAYVVYDLKNNLIGLGQTNFNSTTSKIVEFEASQTAIPMVPGVARPPTVQTGNPQPAQITGRALNNIPVTATKTIGSSTFNDSPSSATTESLMSPVTTIQTIGLHPTTSLYALPISSIPDVSSDAPSMTDISLAWLIVILAALVFSRI